MLYTCIIFVLCVHLSLSHPSRKFVKQNLYPVISFELRLRCCLWTIATSGSPQKQKKTLEAQASLSWYYLAANDPHQCWIAENTACESFLKTSSALHTLSHAYIVWRYKCIHTMLCATMYVWDVYSLYNHFNSTMSQLQDVCKTCVSL